MTCKIPVLLLLAFLPALCLAQRGLGGRFQRGGTRAMQLIEEIYVLQRLVPLQLTDAQLDETAQLYAKYPAGAEPDQAEAIVKLQAIKQRLLGGTPLVATDQATIRDLMRQTLQSRRPDANTPPPPPGAAVPGAAPPGLALPQDTALSPLEQALWDLLDPGQKAILLGDVRGPAANGQKVDAALGKQAMKQIARLLPLDDQQWPGARDKLAAALAAGAGEPKSPQVDNCRQLFVDYLDRLHKMPPTDFANRQDELVAELLALLPPKTNLVVAMATYDPALIHDAMSSSLLSPRAPELLQQMKAARAKTQAP